MEKSPNSKNNEKPNSRESSRRDFLKMFGAAAGALTVLPNEALAKQVLEEVIGKEKPGEPTISLDILLSLHMLPEDLITENFDEKFLNADVLLLEYPWWSKELEENFNAVSEGTLTPEQSWEKQGISLKDAQQLMSFQDAILQRIYKSKKYISSVDIPDGPQAELLQSLLPTMGVEFGNDWNETLRIFRDKWRFFADQQIPRERYMVEAFADLSEKIKHREIPQLRNKESINIIFQVGTNHTGLYHKLHGKDPNNVQRTMSMPHVFGLTDELLRRYMFNKKVDDEFLATAFLGSIIQEFYPAMYITNEQKAARLERLIVSLFSTEEIRDLIKSVENTQDVGNVIMGKIYNHCAKKGLTLPTSEEEFEKLSLT